MWLAAGGFLFHLFQYALWLLKNLRLVFKKKYLLSPDPGLQVGLVDWDFFYCFSEGQSHFQVLTTF